MANFYPIEISGPHTYRLSDIFGVLQDLNWVREVCALLLPQIGDPKSNTSLMEALQSAAIIRYCRCFSGGVRTEFIIDQSFIDRLPEPLRRTHDHVKAIRDKHLAHSVNDWELNVPVARVKQDGDAKTVVGVSVQGHRMIGLAQDDIESLQQLATALEALVKEVFSTEQEAVFEVVKEIPVDHLEREAGERMPLPGVGPVDRARGR